MLLSTVHVLVMGGLFFYMVRRARYAAARRMALIPLAVCGVEMLASGLLSASLVPALTVLLCGLRGVIVLCCVAAMRRDAALARRRRSAQRRAMATVPVPCRTAETALSRCA